MSGETKCECGHAESRHEERQDFDGYPSFIFCTDCIGNAVHPFRRATKHGVNAWHKPAWDDIPPGDGKWHPPARLPPLRARHHPTGEPMSDETVCGCPACRIEREYRESIGVDASPPPAVTGEAMTDDWSRLQEFVREHGGGRCKVLSLGDACPCMLCVLDRLCSPSADGALREAAERALAAWDAGPQPNLVYQVRDALESLRATLSRVPSSAAASAGAEQLIDWMDRESITLKASPQRNYKDWGFTQLEGSTDAWHFAHKNGGTLLEAMRYAYEVFIRGQTATAEAVRENEKRIAGYGGRYGEPATD